jgi:hypothetical protein
MFVLGPLKLAIAECPKSFQAFLWGSDILLVSAEESSLTLARPDGTLTQYNHSGQGPLALENPACLGFFEGKALILSNGRLALFDHQLQPQETKLSLPSNLSTTPLLYGLNGVGTDLLLIKSSLAMQKSKVCKLVMKNEKFSIDTEYFSSTPPLFSNDLKFLWHIEKVFHNSGLWFCVKGMHAVGADYEVMVYREPPVKEGDTGKIIQILSWKTPESQFKIQGKPCVEAKGVFCMERFYFVLWSTGDGQEVVDFFKRSDGGFISRREMAVEIRPILNSTGFLVAEAQGDWWELRQDQDLQEAWQVPLE